MGAATEAPERRGDPEMEHGPSWGFLGLGLAVRFRARSSSSDYVPGTGDSARRERQSHRS